MSQSPSSDSEPNYSPPGSPRRNSPPPTKHAFPSFPHSAEPNYSPPPSPKSRDQHHHRLGISRASRTMTKKGTVKRYRASKLNSITRALTGVETEGDLKKHYDLFTFHKRYTPFKPHGGKGKQKSLFGEADKYIKEYWQSFPHPPVEKDPSRRQFLKPCALVQMHHLFLFNKPTHRMPTTFLPAWKKAVDLVEELLRLPRKLKFPTANDLQYVRFDPRKFAGVEYARRGLRKRGDAHETALQDAKEAWACLMSGTRVLPHDVRLGGKGKIRDIPPPGTPLSANLVGRLILMLSHRDLLMLGNVEQVLTEAYLEPKYPIAVGFRWCHGEPTKFADHMEEYHRFYCLDAYKFDANITEWLTIAALRILRDQFLDGNSAEYDAYWEFVQESMIRVIIQRDDGIRMQKHQGSTSGHCFNSLVQSVITLLVGYTTFFHKAPDATAADAKRVAYLLSLGDELLMALKRPYSNWTVPEIAEVALEGCGIDWSGKKSFCTTRVADDFTGDFRGILFLGKRMRLDQFWVRGQVHHVVTPYRPFQETVECLYYPQNFPGRGKEAIMMTYERTLAAYIDAAGNPDTRKWLDGLLGWLENKGARPPSGWDRDQQLNFMSELDTERFPVPNPERWDLQHWMEYTHLPRTNPRVETCYQRKARMAEKRQRIRLRWARLGLRGGQQQNRYLHP